MISEIFAVWCDIVIYNQLKWRKFGSASVRPYRNRGVAPLFASKESPFYLHFEVRKNASKVLLYMKDLQMWAYCPHSRHMHYFIIHCPWLKINVDFRGESVRWSQTPSPLAYAVYAFINVDNCERPLSVSSHFNDNNYYYPCKVLMAYGKLRLAPPFTIIIASQIPLS